MNRPAVEKPQIDERGAQGATSDRRLFMQLLAFGDCADSTAAVDAMAHSGVAGVVYEDVNDPRGIAVLSFSDDPTHFVTAVRAALLREPFASLTPKPEYTMLGRTYSLGYEPDLNDTLFDRPRRTVLNKAWPWAVWYPLRRSGAFEQLTAEQQRGILMEHGTIGRAFGEADYAHDVRLACHGLDKHDNDFVIGLTGGELYPLSAIVQRMRKTQQTSMYLERLGPFFVGRAIWQADQ